MDILRTYYYDYHCLRISLITSQTFLDCDKLELELDNALVLGNSVDKEKLELRIKARTAIINKQQQMLDNMAKVIKGLPEQFTGIEHIVFQLRYIDGLPCTAIASELNYTDNYIYRICSKILDKFNSYLKSTKVQG